MDKHTQPEALYSPAKLLAGFAKGRIVLWILLAAGVHVVFIGVTSMGYIRDRWIDPVGAQERKAAAEAAQKEIQRAGTASGPAGKTTAAATKGHGSTNGVAAASSGTVSTSAESRLLAERKDTAVVRRITEKAKTNEIPAQPNELGISIDDTNPR
jgi:hypothetical protein